MHSSPRPWFCLTVGLLFSASWSAAQGTLEEYPYQGYPVGADYAEQSNITMASRLKGHLLIEHGDIDDNVHVVETMRLTDALIKANKDFDQLIFPNMYHGEGGNPYLIRRRWDYFVHYLLGVNPPPDFAIHEERQDALPRAR